MPSITDQIKKYQSAADGPRNVGSMPSKGQMNNAKNISIGNSRGTIDKKSTSGLGSARNSGLKPSMEGYRRAPSTLIAGNDSGYNNPRLQTARNKPRGVSTERAPRALTGRNSTNSNIKDYRNKGFAKRNSICKMDSIVKKRSSL